MRIAKVSLAFFSIGFLAGSFERAAGLGYPGPSTAARDRAVAVTVIRNTASVMASLAPYGALPDELLARTAFTPGGTPPVASEGLAEALQEPDGLPAAGRGAASAGMRQGASRVNLRKLRRRFASLGPRSLPDDTRISLAPAPVSLPGPGDDNPEAEAAKAEPKADIDREFAYRGAEFILPIERGRVTSLFHQGRYHPAIDLAGPLGSRVQATTRRQRVISAGWRGGYGNAVVARDESGRMHLYGHLQRIIAKVGSILDQGQMLGTLGSTGHSTGPHVHYELKTRAGGHLDPVTYLFGRRVGRGYAWNGSRATTRAIAGSDSHKATRSARGKSRKATRSAARGNSRKTTRAAARANNRKATRAVARGNSRKTATRFAGRSDRGQPRPR